MGHIFISYARADRPVVEKLSHALESAGHSVWWDRHITGGAAFAKDIEAQLHKSDAVIVVWSANAVESDWVKDEAVFARDKGKLIPISLYDGEAPIGFRQYQMIDFQRWKGDPDHAEFRGLLSALAQKLDGEDAPSVTPPPVEKARAPAPAILAGIGGAILALVAAAFFLMRGGGEPDADVEKVAAGRLPAPEEVSIAVLPFADMSPEGNQEYFADGLSEELLNVLARVDGLKVASRTSSFAVKDEVASIGDIAQRLQVNHILEGSVRKMNNRVRITAQLIDARDDRHLWSETYDRHLSDIFRIQDEIATAVLGELRGKLGMDEKPEIVIKPATDNLNAYDKYLKARELFIARGRANVRESLTLFEEITQEDPDFARGWEGLAAVYAIATSWGILDRDYSALSLVAAKKALDADPDLSMPYAVMGLTYRTHYPTPWAESISNLEKAIERDPKNSSAWLWLGMDMMAIGDPDRAIEAFDQCLEIDAAARLCRKYRSISNLVKGNVDSALEDAETNAENGYFSDFDVYVPVFLARGDRLTAFTVSRNIYWWGGFPHTDYINALENPEDQPEARIEKLFDWGAEKKVDIADQTNVLLAMRAYDRINVETFDNDYEDLWLPAYAHYRSSDAFKKLAADLGLIDYWREVGFPEQCRVLGDDDFTCS
ncbi:MAG: TIR domain-containing protein [Pseudomonadota bacterium]